VCHIFYLFSGSSRKGSVSAWAKKLGSRMGITDQVEMIDIKVRPNWDLTKSKSRQVLLNKIRSGRYFAVLISPPCSTFTRATWANQKGPRPVRSYVQPRGLQRLTWSERQKAKWGNELTDFSFQVCVEVSKTDTMLLFENPGSWSSTTGKSLWPTSSQYVAMADLFRVVGKTGLGNSCVLPG
jgi:hypothetical protein